MTSTIRSLLILKKSKIVIIKIYIIVLLFEYSIRIIHYNIIMYNVLMLPRIGICFDIWMRNKLFNDKCINHDFDL